MNVEDQKPEAEFDENFKIKLIFFYIFSFVWLSLIPVFVDNSEHFGFGLVPGLLSAFVVPVLFGISIRHLVYIWQDNPKLERFSYFEKIALMVAGLTNSFISTLCFLFVYLGKA